MRTTLRVAFASAVRHAADYLRILAADDRVELVGIVEESDAPGWVREDSRAVAESVGLPYAEVADVASAAEALVSAVDLVVVCAEPTRHARLAAGLLEAGLDVLVDKPVATTLAGADRLAAVAARTGGTCAVVNRTHAPALRRLRAWVDAGHVGLPRHLDLEFFASGSHFATSVERPELVVDRTLSGGGELLNFLGYCADAVHHLTGLRTVEVHAFTGALFLDPHREAGVEDTAVVTLGLDRGVTATVTLGRVPFAPGGTPTTSSVRLLGSHGHAVGDDDAPAVARYGADGRTTLAPDAGQVAAAAYLRHVVGAVLAGERPDYGIEEARATLAVIDAAYRSVEASDVVTVEHRTVPEEARV
ncbi:putative dehydrogenase [Cellulosimicrobium cellulans]|uniref:Gfo/Idh/MocA family protein n=1 Tax=Cellulosimicrobium cellulans TaxID=1710 RepID=UPI00195D48AD|nr:Gfo/Idh/MocA family oxidoreductase [Cellulosimicrobium cellulans]MBM7817961.1 putative dehydrogenase [Cellulosimicrobium cellulans]